ncbi:MAG: signal transduction protein [Frankiales bacterium]|nr:signal transduction protein [Frankiales bacterium]
MSEARHRVDSECMALLADQVAHLDTNDGALELLYQPEVDLATGAIVAMEGLLRWHTQDLGVLAPPAFFAAAESAGQMPAIGEWVLRAGAAEAAAWQSLRGPARQLRLNVTTSQLLDPRFSDLVSAVVAEHHLPVGALGLEVSEDSLQVLGDDAPAVLTELRATGVALAVDDTTFFATLAVIEHLPVDVVKLGTRHVRGVDLSDDASMAATVISRAHDRGLVVVAEGVETWGEAVRLLELGCDRAHGWLYASAQRGDKARWLLEQGRGWRGAVVSPGVQAAQFVPSPRAAV